MMADFVPTQKFIELFKQEAERAKKRLDTFDRLFPAVVARIRRHEAGEYTDEEITSIKKRMFENDYPPTDFGVWLREEDAAAIDRLAHIYDKR